MLLTRDAPEPANHLPGRFPVGRMRANGRPAGRTFFETSPDHRATDARPATNDLDAGGGHMRQRSLGLTLFGGLAIIVSACGGGATPSPSASALAASGIASAPASASGVRARRKPQRPPPRCRAQGRSSSPTSVSSRTSRSTSRPTKAPRPRPTTIGGQHDVIVTKQSPTTPRTSRASSTRATTSS